MFSALPPGGAAGSYRVPGAPAPPYSSLSELEVAVAEISKALRDNQARPQYMPSKVHDGMKLIASQNGIQDKLMPHVSDMMLRLLARNNVVAAAVIANIVAQVKMHFRRPENEGDVGFCVRQKDLERPLTKAAAAKAKEIEDILWQGGVITPHPNDGMPEVWDSLYMRRAQRLPEQVALLMQDSLILDKGFIEVEGSEPGAGGKRKYPVMYWSHVDGALIRRCDPSVYVPVIRNGSNGADDATGRVRYVQLGVHAPFAITKEYTWEDGALWVRNPYPDAYGFGYGLSETQMAAELLVSAGYAVRSNTDFFTHNHVPQGILAILGNPARTGSANDFALKLQQEIGFGGGGTIYRVPVLQLNPTQGSDAKWIPLQDKTRFDMVSRQWLSFCISVVCAIFQCHPEEIGMDSFGGPDQTLNMPDPESSLRHSLQRNVLAKVTSLCHFLTKAVVDRIDEDFCVTIQGLHSAYNPEQARQAELDTMFMQTGYTPNELRAMRDLPPIMSPRDNRLWRNCAEELQEKWFPSERERVFAIRDLYEERGGELSAWPDAPVGCPGALQIWQGEAQAAQGGEANLQGMMQQQAEAELQGSRDAESGARNSMEQMAQAEHQGALQGEAEERKAGLDGSMRVPGLDDPSARGRMANLQKSLPAPPVVRVVIGG